MPHTAHLHTAPKPDYIRLATAQCHTLPTIHETLIALFRTAHHASRSNVDILLFPEAYLGGYPRGATFGTVIGARDEQGREQFLHYFKGAVDLGDTPDGGGDRWVRRELRGDGDTARGDGTREELERVARETGVFLAVGLIEKAGGSLYCAVVYVCPRRGIIGKRRKVMPTGSERLVWAQGQPSSLRAVTTTIRGVKITLAAAICWENYMPLLRHSLYSQNVSLYLAPTADARDTWLPLMRTIACEGRCFVLCANQCIRWKNLPDWIQGGRTEERPGEEHGSDDEPQKHSQYRRKSIITEEGHEIALLGEKKDNFEEAVISGDERKSDNGPQNENENVSPADQSKDSQPTVGSTDELEKVRPRVRKASFVTEHGHEIILPDKSKSAKTINGGHGFAQSNKSDGKEDEFASRGGSCIVSPNGEVLAGPLWEKEDELLVIDVDFDDCIRGRLDLDVAGSYSRSVIAYL
jgi:nitrilase